MEDNEKLQGKLRLENLERCLNCNRFALCHMSNKEDIVECILFGEVETNLRKIIVDLNAAGDKYWIDFVQKRLNKRR
jgi:hypothetical protein